MICFLPAICDHFPSSGCHVNRYLRPLFLSALLLFPALPVLSSLPDQSEQATAQPPSVAPVPSAPLKDACAGFNELNIRIRDGRIGRAEARSELVRRLAEVRDRYARAGGGFFTKGEWVFPLEGYGIRAVGGGRRHGYSAGGYDFYRGNRHGGHPSYDIFIRDRNQDSRDDRSGRPVNVRSLTGGVVVALEGAWQPGNRLRGGKYLWIYDPANDLLVYYAHNGELNVGLGDMVRPGDLLATVGRSGYNAYKRRSPTHLHLTVVKVEGGQMKPVPVYDELKRSKPL